MSDRAKHVLAVVAVICGALVSAWVGAGSPDEWSEVLRPSFVAGVLGAVGSAAAGVAGVRRTVDVWRGKK